MGKSITLMMATVGSLVAFAGPLRGQEVNSDIHIPPPRELMSGAPAINGLFAGTESLLQLSDGLLQSSLARAASGVLDEGQTREEFGDFMTSLLIKSGIIAFDRPSAGLATSIETSADGSRPAWVGRTPMALSVSRTRRSDAGRRR